MKLTATERAMIHSLLDPQETLHDARMEMGYQAVSYNAHRPLAWYLLLEIAHRVAWGARFAVCLLVGHDDADEGYGNPESGCIAIRCQRCGHAYPVVRLY